MGVLEDHNRLKGGFHMDDLAKPKNESNLLSKLPFALFGLGMLLVIVGNILSVRGNGPYVDNGIGVRSVGFLVAIGGMIWFLVSQFAGRMAKREGADLIKKTSRPAATDYRPLPVYLEYDLHIAFCYIAMVVSILSGLFSIPDILRSIFSMGRFFTPFMIFRSLSYLLFQLLVSYLFWLVSRILKRMQHVELERQRADLEFLKSASSAAQTTAPKSSASDLDDVFGGNQ